MTRKLLTIALVTAALSFGMKSGFALDPQVSTGVGGIGRTSLVTAGSGRSTDDGLAHTGYPSRLGSGMLGVTSGGASGGTGRGTEDGFHASGLGRVLTAGVGRSTNETVPGRTPTYINLVVGRRMEPMVGSRGP